MSTILTSVPPSASVVAQSQQSGTHTKADGSAAANNANATAIGHAAVVNVTASGKARSTSTGNAKQVDPSFEKEELKEKKAKKEEDGKAESGKSLNVQA